LVRKRKGEMIEREIALHLNNYKASGAELIMGTGRFIAPKTIAVSLNDGGSRVLRGKEVVINVGSHALIPDVPGLHDARPLTHIEALELDYAPEHLIILGGGYVGIEMAQTYRRFGSSVTIIEPADQLMSREEAEIAEEMRRILAAEQIEILLGAEPTNVEGLSGDKVAVEIRTPEGLRKIEGSDLIVATGRVPNTAGIGLDLTGVETTDRGFVRVDERLQTTVPDIWAIGECAGSPQFTHVSVDDFRIVRDNMAGGNRRTSDRLIPHVMFTDPPLARVGMDEGEARRRGVSARIAKLPMSSVLRTNATDETDGFMKIVVGANDDQILGFSMIGAEAGEVMTAVQTAMLAQMPYPKLRDAVIAHLTYSEGLGPLLVNLSAATPG
jgi:pyruvate/2-oxoglutarate dehydrogenase complex dihydrolipoamide dehydrogenase (E3) component